MSFATYIKQCLLLTSILLLFIVAVSWLISDQALIWIYLAASVLFVLFNTGIFIYTVRISTRGNAYAFNNIIGASFIIKLILSIGFLILWNKLVQHETKIHVVHYLIVYILYTIHEVYFLTILAKRVK